MPVVDTNRLKGNYAQAVVSAWLSRACLVRPVAEGTDIGIDLYCESVLEGQPFLHFWAQVKAIPRDRVTMIEGQAVASYAFETKHLAYWDRQPIPVYAFLVPVPDWPPGQPQVVYGVRITEALVRNGLPSTASLTLSSSEGFELATIDADLRQFVTEIVPWDTSILLLKRGMVAPLASMAKDAPKRFPRDIGWQHLDRVANAIRDASVHGLYHSLLAERATGRGRELRKVFQGLADVEQDELDLFGISMLVRAACEDGDSQRARGYLTRALARADTDSRASTDDRRQRTEGLKVLLQELDEPPDKGDQPR